MDEMYGLQYQRSYSTGVMLAGSRSENESAGFVNALTSNCLYSPGRPARSCATSRGARIELSSRPPVETIPVIVSVCVRLPASILILLPARKFRRCASEDPATPSSVPSENQRPSTCHHGSVAEIPVVNVPPSGTETEWLYHVPINSSCEFFCESFCESEVAIETGTSRNGANPITLLRQKIVFSLPKSA